MLQKIKKFYKNFECQKFKIDEEGTKLFLMNKIIFLAVNIEIHIQFMP